MHQRIDLAGIASCVVLLVACGGQSLSSNGGDAGSGANQAGTANEAGTNSGGASNNAGASSSGGATNEAGRANNEWLEACFAAPTAGDASCSAAFMYYTHSAERGLCVPFLYGGCGGTRNLYKTLAECQAACAGGIPSSDTCERASECVLGSPGCCSACDGPSITGHDFIAYNPKHRAEVVTCGDVACGACPEPEGERTYKYFIPNCVAGRCVVQDIRQTPFTECAADTDCMLRHGSGCCQGCGGGSDDVISVRNDGSFEKLVCEAPTPCLACVPAEIEKRPVCSDGRCGVGDP